MRKDNKKNVAALVAATLSQYEGSLEEALRLLREEAQEREAQEWGEYPTPTFCEEPDID